MYTLLVIVSVVQRQREFYSLTTLLLTPYLSAVAFCAL
jgi:hypothetical protein